MTIQSESQCREDIQTTKMIALLLNSIVGIKRAALPVISDIIEKSPAIVYHGNHQSVDS